MLEVEMNNITKRFPGVLADDDVSFSVEKGEVHALMGENGAGKSVLMSMLAGLYRPDEGEIKIRGQKRDFHSPLDAIKAGVGMVFQEFQLFPQLTIAENVVFNQEPRKGILIDTGEAVRKVEEISNKYGLAVDPSLKACDATVGVLQRTEIIKALYREAKILVLDEPTAVLTPQETDKLFEILKQLNEDGCTIILITHKLREVMELSNRVTVLRDGKVAGKFITDQTSPAELTRAMTGRDVDLSVKKLSEEPGDVVLDLQSITMDGDAGSPALSNVSLKVRAGEIVGIAGVAGNGQAELAKVAAGLAKAQSGRVMINGRDVTTSSVKERRQSGLAYIPEDRLGTGSAPGLGADYNLVMGHHYQEPIRKSRILIDGKAVKAFANRLISKYSVKIANETVKVGTLSGGNLQKILVARELEYDSKVLIAEQPTRGVDVGSIEFIHNKLAEYRDGGAGILLISAELSEIMTRANRILVMYEGAIIAELEAATTDENQIGFFMAGGKVQQDV